MSIGFPFLSWSSLSLEEEIPNLISPHAPSKKSSFFLYILQIWEKIRCFVYSIFFKNQKVTPPPFSAPELVIAIKTAPFQQKSSYKKELFEVVKGAAFSGGVSWLFGSSKPLLYFLAHRSISTGTFALEKVANYTFPKLSTIYKKVGSLALATTITWLVFSYSGEELGYLFYLGNAVNGGNLLFQARLQNDQMQLKRREDLLQKACQIPSMPIR